MRKKSKNRVKLVVEDTEGRPQYALSRIKKLHDSGIKIVIGPQSSAEAEAVLSYANKNDMILISPFSDAASLAKAGDNLFRFSPDTTLQAQATAQLIKQDGIESIILVYRDDVWGADLSKALETKFVKLKGKVTGDLSYNTDTDNFSQLTGELLKLVSESREKYGLEKTAVVLMGFNEAVTILIDANRFPLLRKVHWYGSSATAKNPNIISDRDAAGFAAKTDYQNPIFKISSKSKKGRLVANQLRYRIRRAPEAQILAAYDALWVASNTYYQTGLSDIKTFKKAFMNVASTYNGLTGIIALNKAGDRLQADFDIWTVRKYGSRYTWKKVGVYESESGSLQKVGKKR